eukprot:1299986-Pleurochrysis_carterae.AAC.1
MSATEAAASMQNRLHAGNMRLLRTLLSITADAPPSLAHACYFDGCASCTQANRTRRAIHTTTSCTSPHIPADSFAPISRDPSSAFSTPAFSTCSGLLTTVPVSRQYLA